MLNDPAPRNSPGDGVPNIITHLFPFGGNRSIASFVHFLVARLIQVRWATNCERTLTIFRRTSVRSLARPSERSLTGSSDGTQGVVVVGVVGGGINGRRNCRIIWTSSRRILVAATGIEGGWTITARIGPNSSPCVNGVAISGTGARIRTGTRPRSCRRNVSCIALWLASGIRSPWWVQRATRIKRRRIARVRRGTVWCITIRLPSLLSGDWRWRWRRWRWGRPIARIGFSGLLLRGSDTLRGTPNRVRAELSRLLTRRR